MNFLLWSRTRAILRHHWRGQASPNRGTPMANTDTYHWIIRVHIIQRPGLDPWYEYAFQDRGGRSTIKRRTRGACRE